MRKTLREIALYFKSNIIREIPSDYPIDGEYLYGYSPEEVRAGVLAFRDMLDALFDYVAEHYQEMEMPAVKKIGKYKGTGSFRQEYPLFQNLMDVLYVLACSGTLEKRDKPTFVVNGAHFHAVLKAARAKMVKECLVHLADMGFDFGSVDVRDAKFRLASCGDVVFTWPTDPDAMIGCKALADATRRILCNAASKPPDEYNGSADINSVRSIFLQCNYHALANTTTKKPVFHVPECVGALGAEDAAFLLDLDRLLTMNNCKCDIRFTMGYKGVYSHRPSKAVLCTFFIRLDGLELKANLDCMDQYSDYLVSMPSALLDGMKRGFDCGRTAGVNTCSPKCKAGMRFAVDGLEYSKCRGANFYIRMNSSEDRESIRRLIGKEIDARKAG